MSLTRLNLNLAGPTHTVAAKTKTETPATPPKKWYQTDIFIYGTIATVLVVVMAIILWPKTSN